MTSLISIHSEPQPGESILWQGQPAQGIRLRASDALMIPFSLLWGGFAIFWEVLAVSSKVGKSPVGLIFPLFGLPFVVMGLYLIFGRFFVDAKSRRNTTYAVTNHRIIIKSGIFSRKTKSLNLASLPETTVTEKSDGSGSITFGQSIYPLGAVRGFNYPGSPYAMAPAFEIIPQVRTVYNLILSAQRRGAA